MLIAGLVAVASGATGAYFSDTNNGAITGDIGSIEVTTSGGDGPDGLVFAWDNMLPGVQYSATATYQNTGENVQDVWLVFPNATALSCLNSLGRFGAVRITDSNTGELFYSANLNDHPHDALPYLPSMIKLASNVGPTASGIMTFTFAYASKMTTPEYGGVFNKYPKPYTTGNPPLDLATGYDQVTVITGQVGEGLPFQIVATQPGIAPGVVGDYAGF